jgi:hypothetical protein
MQKPKFVINRYGGKTQMASWIVCGGWNNPHAKSFFDYGIKLNLQPITKML